MRFSALEKLESVGLKVKDVVVLIDRQSGASAALEKAGMHLHSITTLTALLDEWESRNKVPAEQIQAARQFIGEHG